MYSQVRRTWTVFSTKVTLQTGMFIHVKVQFFLRAEIEVTNRTPVRFVFKVNLWMFSAQMFSK